jgi:hypothetical protein
LAGSYKKGHIRFKKKFLFRVADKLPWISWDDKETKFCAPLFMLNWSYIILELSCYNLPEKTKWNIPCQ